MSEQSPEHRLRNLLAVIHRDGGHYAAKHNLEKATEDAIQVWGDREVQIDALETENAELRAKLEAATQALYDVAHGMVPASFTLEGEPLEVRSRLFTWSQERARVGLATAQKGEEE